jgi:integrase
MARGINLLTALAVKKATAPGRYADGGGLSMVIDRAGSKKWVFRFVDVSGKRRDLGLGSAVLVPLAEARDAAERARQEVRQGLDPIAERRERKRGDREIPTFKVAAERLYAESVAGWSEKHAAQWWETVERHALPSLGSERVDRITSPMVRDCLLKFWTKTPETARRVRQRIGAVLAWAVAEEHRGSTLDLRTKTLRLPEQQEGTNFDALPYAHVPGFLAALRDTGASEAVKDALTLLALTAARSGEIRGMVWGEVDLDAALWSIPAERMKMRKPHVVPLSASALDLLRRRAGELLFLDPASLVFPGSKPGKPLSDMSLSMQMRRMKLDATPHGMRSSFKDWCREQTSFPDEVSEAALAHRDTNKVRRAYARSDLLERRRELMEAWSRFCCPPAADNVLTLTKGAAG